jgi:hypothetical protein
VPLLRSLLLILLALSAAPSLAAAETLEAEALAVRSATGQPYAEDAASGRRALLLWTNGAASGSVTLATPSNQLTVRARGDQCSVHGGTGSPALTVRISGQDVISIRPVAAATWSDVRVPAALPAGTHSVSVAFTNDARTKTCDRNLRVDRLVLTPTPRVNPFVGAKLWVDPNSNARRQADAWRATRPAEAAAMDLIADGSQADWFGDWSGDVRSAVQARVTTITAAGALPLLVAYNIPQRDCGGYSAGGQGSPDAYRTWIRAFAAGIGARRAAVILEPDALGSTQCLSAADLQTRYALLADAVAVLSAQPTVAVYLDAGHSRWLAASEIAARLRKAGIAGARGFALNVSNYNATNLETAYGRQVSDLVDGKPFVIDSSRNGLGATDESCNAPRAALGQRAGTTPPDTRIDALLWIKRPGESDGTCNGGPSAGTWWPRYALSLSNANTQSRV